MKFWKDNRKDGEWELPNAEVADRFFKSPFAELWKDYQLARVIPMFITANESEGGLQSVFDHDKDYEEVCELIRRRLK